MSDKQPQIWSRPMSKKAMMDILGLRRYAFESYARCLGLRKINRSLHMLNVTTFPPELKDRFLYYQTEAEIRQNETFARFRPEKKEATVPQSSVNEHLTLHTNSETMTA